MSETNSTAPQAGIAPHPSSRPHTGTRRVVLITGASGGIGAELARIFARHGHDLALVARSADKLEELAAEIAAGGRMRPLVLAVDLAKEGAAGEIAAALDAAGAAPGILVNNAGFGLAGEALELDQADQLAMIDLNVRAATEITLRFLPAICRARGKILNVASLASYLPGGPRMAVYYGSKAYLLSFSRGLYQELRAQGVTVTAVCPSYTATGFQARAGIGPDMALARFGGPTAAEVAKEAYAGLMAGRREVIPGLQNKLTAFMLPFFPTSMVLKLTSWLQENRPTQS